MFGYIVMNKPEIKFKDFDLYRSFYCGLCRELRERYGVTGQISLTYDMTFVILLLSGLYEPPTRKGTTRCVIHPVRKQPVRKNAVTEYAADMNVFLAYYKCEDDWKDEKKLLSFLYGKLLREKEKKAEERWYRKVDRIVSLLHELSEMEKSEEQDVDRVSGCFGKIMEERGIHMGLGLGGITTPMCDLLAKGLVNKLVDTQDFDQGAIESIKTNPNHFEISASEYANPFNKGAYVNKLDFVILASLEVDVNFNCNVVVGSDGMITGAQGGHPDTAAGAKCTIVIAPLLQGRIPAICTNVTTVTTPGESVDVVITDYGIAINPRRQDLIECMKDVDLPFCTIEELRDKAYAMVGTPDPVQFDDRIVGVIEARDGTIIDVVRKIKDYEFTTDVE